MSTQLIFTEEYRYLDNASGITVPVTLGYGAQSLIVTAKVDTGAEVCLFSNENGLKLGLSVEQGLPLTLSGIGGSADGRLVSVSSDAFCAELAIGSVRQLRCYPIATLRWIILGPNEGKHQRHMVGGQFIATQIHPFIEDLEGLD